MAGSGAGLPPSPPPQVTALPAPPAPRRGWALPQPQRRARQGACPAPAPPPPAACRSPRAFGQSALLVRPSADVSPSSAYLAPPPRRHRALQPPGRRAPLLQSLRGVRGGGERAPPRPPHPPSSHRRDPRAPAAAGEAGGHRAGRRGRAAAGGHSGCSGGGGDGSRGGGAGWEPRGGPRVRTAAGRPGGGAGWSCGRQRGGRQEGTGRGTAVPTLPPPSFYQRHHLCAPPSYGSARRRALHAAPCSAQPPLCTLRPPPCGAVRCCAPPHPRHPPGAAPRGAGARLQVPFCRGTAGAAAVRPAGLRAPLRAAAMGRRSRQC